MHNGHISGTVSVDRDNEGQLFLARDQIVLTDSDGDVICLVPYEGGDADADEYEQLAEEIAAQLNAAGELRAALAALAEIHHRPGGAGVDERVNAWAQADTLLARLNAAELAAHRADDPHCTCNDCIADHAAKLEG